MYKFTFSIMKLWVCNSFCLHNFNAWASKYIPLAFTPESDVLLGFNAEETAFPHP